MRETIARGVVVLTLCLLAALSGLFARLHNPAAPERPEPSVAEPGLPEVSPALAGVAPEEAGMILERGRAVYAGEGCAGCHSIAGTGSPRSPLDGTGARWDPNELEAWTTGSGFASDLLSAGIVRRKQRYRDLPAGDLEALVAYLSGLTNVTGRSE